MSPCWDVDSMVPTSALHQTEWSKEADKLLSFLRHLQLTSAVGEHALLLYISRSRKDRYRQCLCLV